MSDFIEDIRYMTKFLEKKTVVQLALKTGEECGELARAALIWDRSPGTKYRNVDPDAAVQNVVEETVDTVQCAFATLFRVRPDISRDEIQAMFDRKLQKWNEVLSREKS